MFIFKLDITFLSLQAKSAYSFIVFFVKKIGQFRL